MHVTVMHGAGNSFVIPTLASGTLQGGDLRILALRLCAAKKTDGMIVLTPAADEGADLDMLFYNSDGSLGEMCGNGARCAARWGFEHGLVEDETAIRIRATAGLVTARRISGELYQVRLNDPSVVDLGRLAQSDAGLTPCSYVELGDPGIPHAVVRVFDDAFANLDALREKGRALRRSEAFPRGANVTFASIDENDRVRAITFERGVEDFTLACGTGCGATAAALCLLGDVAGETVTVDMPGGTLSVSLRRAGDTVRDILLTGPTALVEECELAL